MQDWIRGRLSALNTPCLFRPIPGTMAHGGLLKPAALNGLDALFRQDAAHRTLDWTEPSGLTPSSRSEDRWCLASALQKAIRSGDVWTAIAAANALHLIDPGYLWRRLVVCAVEDVMLGNLYAVACTLALAGSKFSREIAGDRKTALWLTAQLAGGVKDRSACNMCVLADFDRSLHPLMGEWAKQPDKFLAQRAVDMTEPVKERMLAAWLLAGTKKFWNLNVPTDNDRPRWTLMRLMVESGMPLILNYIADRAALRGAGCLFVSALPIWQLIAGEDVRFGVRTNSQNGALSIGALPAAAYDMRTREGREAIRRWSATPEIAEALEVVPDPTQRLEVLQAAVFHAEGGLLNRRVSTPALDAVHIDAIRTELRYCGVQNIADQTALFQAIKLHWDTLASLRREVVSQLRPHDRLSCSSTPAAPTSSKWPSLSNPQPKLDFGLPDAPKRTTAAPPDGLPDFDLARP